MELDNLVPRASFLLSKKSKKSINFRFFRKEKRGLACEVDIWEREDTEECEYRISIGLTDTTKLIAFSLNFLKVRFLEQVRFKRLISTRELQNS